MLGMRTSRDRPDERGDARPRLRHLTATRSSGSSAQAASTLFADRQPGRPTPCCLPRRSPREPLGWRRALGDGRARKGAEPFPLAVAGSGGPALESGEAEMLSSCSLKASIRAYLISSPQEEMRRPRTGSVSGRAVARTVYLPDVRTQSQSAP